MQLPHFPESNHELIQPLFPLNDQELVSLFKHHPDSGRYFVAIFCRYSPIVYSLIRHSARSPVQAEYLFALTWRHIFHELGGFQLPTPELEAGTRQKTFSLQSWIINVTALCINQAVVPEVESIHYTLRDATPPFWCYVEQALDQLPPTERLIILMARTFHWSPTRISAYLQAEGEQLSPAAVGDRLRTAYHQLEVLLPGDIRAIYLGEWTAADDLSDLDDNLDDLLQMPDLAAITAQPASVEPTR